MLRILAALQGQKKTAGVASRRSLIQGTRLLSSALLTAALLAALLASATLLAAALFLALFLFITIALLAAALLSGSRRFDWFIRLTFFFHITFLLFTNRSSRFAKGPFLSLKSCSECILDWKIYR